MIQRQKCPISDHPAEVIFSRPYVLPELRPFAERSRLDRKLEELDYEIRFCHESGLYFQTWVLDDSELAGLYSPAVDEQFFVAEIAKEKLHCFAHVTEEILVMRQLIVTKVPVVLDFGCYWGKWGSMALAHGCQVYGFDVNGRAAAFCAARGIKMISFDEIESLRFDFINVEQVMEHLSDPLPVAKRLAAALKPGGYMKLATPEDRALPRLLRSAQRRGDNAVLNTKTLQSLTPLEHVNLFNHGALRFLGQRAGLRAVLLPLLKWMGAGQLWNKARQINRNFLTPLKRWQMRGPYIWLQKPAVLIVAHAKSE